VRLFELGASALGALCVALALAAGDGGVAQLEDGLARMRQLAEGEDPAGALALGEELLAPGEFSRWRREQELAESRFLVPLLDFADPALDLLRLSGLQREERAHVHFALGVTSLLAQDAKGAIAEFERAHARAGAGELRLDAAYNLGTLALLSGEAWRAQIPELGGTPPAPSQAPAPAPGAGAADVEPEPPDPLAEAKAAYLAALEHFSGRLRLDWGDADTRANTELCLRRLRELEQVEQQREQQQQQQQQDQQQQDQEQQDQEQQDQQQQDQQQQDHQQDQQQQDGAEKPQEPQEQEPKPDEQPQEEQPGEEPQESEPQEVYLTKEEVQRLLDRLQQYEEQGEELRERQRAQRRLPTARDW
jgi:Ca-activated chloride channel family protein